ncbi:MAG: NAD(P)/FAD-dependent oxidoreductase [Myxococcota bacterium]
MRHPPEFSSESTMTTPGSADNPHDVVVVGAGAAGIGVAVALVDAGVEDVVLLERYVVGASFALWPKETRFITPSFPTNSTGMLDLNSIAVGFSPAFSLRVEHPTGLQYAVHLQRIAKYFELKIREEVEVDSVQRDGAAFRLETSQGEIWSKHVVWAVGEYQYPRRDSFPGSQLCRPTARIESYGALEGDDFVVIGGYESGIDAAYHLARRGKRVRVIDRGSPWSDDSSDPSVALSTYSFERMRDPAFGEHVELIPESNVASVDEVNGGFKVVIDDGRGFQTPQPPLFAGGFAGGHGLVGNLFERRADGYPLLNRHDESTLVPGIFLCGPAVRHGNLIFCFIYKYRQRFAVVAKAIATSLGLPAEKLESYRAWGMYLDDLTVCGQDCVC